MIPKSGAGQGLLVYERDHMGAKRGESRILCVVLKVEAVVADS